MSSLYEDGNEILKTIKTSSFFPYKTGNLCNNATSGDLITDNVYVITFNTRIAPYIPYLEDGTREHDIPGAFGRPIPFGIGGRFNGSFHPGSDKHKGFISRGSVNAVIMYYLFKYGGELR